MATSARATVITPVIVMVGIPGSSKSAMARQLAQASDLELISLDRIRFELTGHEIDQSVNQEAWDEAYRRMSRAVACGSGIVIDASNIRRRSRQSITRHCRAEAAVPCYIEAWVMNASLEACLARNAERDRKVPHDAIERMHRQLLAEPVDAVREGFDNIIHVYGNA
jgi:predicted kinase